MSRNADTQAPIPNASDRIAEADVTFRFMSCRQPKTASARSESSQGNQPDVAARLAQTQRRTERPPRFAWIAPLLDRLRNVRL